MVPDSGTQNGSSFRPPYNNLYQGTHSRVQFWVRNLAPETVPFSGPRMSKSRHMPCACDVASDFWWTGCGRAAVSRRTARSLALCCLQSHSFLVAVCLQSGGCLSAAQWQSGCHMGATWLRRGWRLHAVGLGSRCSSGAVLTPTGFPRPQHVPLATSEFTNDILVLPEQWPLCVVLCVTCVSCSLCLPCEQKSACHSP